MPYGQKASASRHAGRPDQPRAGGRCRPDRHRRHLRRQRRSSAGPSPVAASRSCWPPGSASSAPRGGAAGRDERHPRLHARAHRAVAQASRHRLHRPVLPAPGRPLPCRSRDGRQDGRAGGRGQGAAPGVVRGRGRVPSAGRTRCTRSPRCRPSGRCGQRADRGPGLPAVPRAGDQRGAVQRWPRRSGRHDHLRDDLPENDYRRSMPARAGALDANLARSRSSRTSPRPTTPRRVEVSLAWLLGKGPRRGPDPEHPAHRLPRAERAMAAEVVLTRGRGGAAGRGHRRSARGRPSWTATGPTASPPSPPTR